jgi:cytochrome c553
MRSFVVLSTTTAALLLGGCSLYFDTGSGGGGGGGPGGGSIGSLPDAGISVPPCEGVDGGYCYSEDGGDEFGDAGTGPIYPDAQCNGTNCGDPVAAVESQWAACLSVSSTELAQTHAYAIASETSADGICASCHGVGGDGGYGYLSTSQAQMLAAWQQSPGLGIIFTPAIVPGPNGDIVYQMAVNKAELCGTGTEQTNNMGAHPTYNCDGLVGGVDPMAALEQFRVLVQAKLDAGECPAP